MCGVTCRRHRLLKWCKTFFPDSTAIKPPSTTRKKYMAPSHLNSILYRFCAPWGRKYLASPLAVRVSSVTKSKEWWLIFLSNSNSYPPRGQLDTFLAVGSGKELSIFDIRNNKKVSIPSPRLPANSPSTDFPLSVCLDNGIYWKPQRHYYLCGRYNSASHAHITNNTCTHMHHPSSFSASF